jgi:hypothetical protein
MVCTAMVVAGLAGSQALGQAPIVGLGPPTSGSYQGRSLVREASTPVSYGQFQPVTVQAVDMPPSGSPAGPPVGYSYPGGNYGPDGMGYPSTGACGCQDLLDNLSVFTGLDGSKGPEDLGINADFGFRSSVAWAYPIMEEYGLGVQVGSAINYHRTALRMLPAITGTHDRVQSFTTFGVFQRTDLGINWGVVYDFLAEDYYQDFEFGQWRGQVGYNLTPEDEVGSWTTLKDFGDDGSAGGQRFKLRPIIQSNVFWRHIWANETVTRMWVGLAESHGRFVLVAPGDTSVHTPWVFGGDVFVPLNESWALFGEANFITPNDTGTVTATFGFAFYPGAKARCAGRSRFAPYLPVANNPTFAINLRQ